MKRAHPKVGRNQPCHCGSGVKYKKCHLLADQMRDRFPRISATPLGGGMYNLAISLDGSPMPEGGHPDCPICQAKTPEDAMRLMREMSGEATH